MDDSVIAFPLSRPTKDLLEMALDEDFEHVLIIGLRPEGGGWWSGANMSKETAAYYLEAAKLDIFND